MSKIFGNPALGEQGPRKDGFWQKHQQEVVEAAIDLYGSEAANGGRLLCARGERRHRDYGFWFEVFLRLRNRLI